MEATSAKLNDVTHARTTIKNYIVFVSFSTLTTGALMAQSPDDFTATTHSILVTPTSSSTLTFPILITNDNTIESSETFQTILSTTNADQVNIGTSSSATITIADDDGK